MTLWLLLGLAAIVVGLWWWLLLVPTAKSVPAPIPTAPPPTLGEHMRDPPSIDRFYHSDFIEWIAVQADVETAASTWADLMQAKSHRKDVTDERLEYDGFETRWLVAGYSDSPWTHIQFVTGASSLLDRHLRELSRRTAADVVLVYGRNDYDKARALACIRYEGGEPRATLLIGEDADQDLMLDYLELSDEEVGDLDFEYDFDAGRDLATEFLGRHGLEDRSSQGALARVDLLIV